MEMSNYIFNILMSKPMVIMSWGFENVIRLENGLQFTVNGFIFQGTVKIIYNAGADTFDVFIGETKHSDVYFDELVGVIDREVETCEADENYETKVNDWLASNI